MSTNRPAQIFEAMHDLVHVYRARMMEVVASIHSELTYNEVRALMFVGRHPGATQKELVQHASADKAQIARLVALLLGERIAPDQWPTYALVFAAVGVLVLDGTLHFARERRPQLQPRA